jgi:hypothetical protein
LAHVDLGHAIGIAGEAHFVARQFRQTGKISIPECWRNSAPVGQMVGEFFSLLALAIDVRFRG